MTSESDSNGTWKHAAMRQSAVFDVDLVDRPEWHARANCGRNGIIGDDPRTRIAFMFPPKGATVAANRARAVCEDCPVKDECRKSARFTSGLRIGVWAGMTSKERRKDPMLRMCPCGTEFETTYPNQAYCGDECRDDARLKSQRRWASGRAS